MKNITKILSFPLISLLMVPSSSFSIEGPEHRTLRAHGMGNAHVAVVDDKDALYYNPAGLNLIGRLGNKKRRPEMGYYSSNYIDMRLNFLGLELPVDEGIKLLDVYTAHEETFQDPNLESFQQDETLVTDLSAFDRKGIPISIVPLEGEFALHNFGMSFFTDIRMNPFLDVGIVFPQAGADMQIDIAGQIGIARAFMHDRLSVGVAYRMARREIIDRMQLGIGDFNNIQQIAQDSIASKEESLTDLGNIGHGMDLGVLWQQTRELRFGAAVQNVFMKLNKESVTPELTFGLNYSPMMFQNNYRWKRKVNFALDFEDMLNSDRGYKFGSKVNMGAEWEQVLIPYIIKGALRGGFKGGYWSAGLSGNLFTVLHLEVATWAEEAGYYTGQAEDRVYMLKFGIGF